MGVRYRKYHKQCKPINCNGRPHKRHCPDDRPKRSNGEYKACGVWCIEFFDDSKQWQSLTFKDVRNKTDAEKRLALYISDRERGQLNLPKKKLTPTLTEYSQQYLAFHKREKENTRLARIRAIQTLSRYLGNYKLDKLTPFVIEKFRLERQEKDQVGANTVNADLAFLRHMLNMACKEGLISNNPCKEVKRSKAAQTRDRILTDAEIKQILDTVQGKDRLMILTALFTGMRLSEVLSLSWQNIDFNRGLIEFSQGKTGKLIAVPLSDLLAEELTEYKNQYDNLGDRVFDNRPVTQSVVARYSNYFSDLFKGMGIYNFTFHNLRHTFSSILQGELGIGAVVVQTMTGHSSLGMLQKYSHSGLDNKQKAIQALTDHVLNMHKNTNKVVNL
ncbi:MAG: site-specific integrase [wastewater metagenome]|nr:site-specific integrase [Candidatus Loosdrechtia aerotolerans]